MDPSEPIRALLFDLGGVVLDVDFGHALTAWGRHSRLAPERLRETFRPGDEAYRRHETGALSDEGFFEHLRELLALECDAAAVQAGWNAVLVAEIRETVELIAALPPQLPRYAISNTNPAHVAEIHRRFPRLLPRFTRVFVSHEIGHRKPDEAAFRHVLQAIGVAAPQALLFDDLPPNVAAARALGMQTVLVRSPADVRAGLESRGLLRRG